MMANRLAVLVLTLNEEKNMKECLSSVLFADELVVIDSGSSDRTIELAQELGANCYVHPMTDGFAGQRNFALQKTKAEWVLFLDADERITPEAANEIRKVVEQGEPYAYEILRRNIVFGQPVQYGGHSPDYSLRLYPRTAISWQGLVHEQALVNLPIRQLKNYMWHHTYTSWERYFFKFNQYTTMMADQMYEKGKRAAWSDIMIRPWVGFIKFYLLKSGWRDGKMGFILAALHFFYTMMKYVKLYYHQAEGEHSNEICNR
ncbi:glycosyltransferase family 2 protein [Azotosporobacter soli]|uniref:glycosyltransferase family 2 protein n=1 Tax=Azotosporobacter soli TaxID=3055040 RepID=UPI0031FF44F7